jgi:hypothetical protein
MGWLSPGSVFRRTKKAAKKVTKAVGKVADEAFEEIIEKPVKKIGKETFDTIAGTTDEERRFILYGQTPEVTPEVTPEAVPDETILEGADRRRRTKYKRSGGAGTLLEGYGVTYREPSKKAAIGG